MLWLLHGAVGQSSDWDELAAGFAKKGQAARAVDLWRFLECEGLSLADWARAFNAEVKADGSSTKVLVGYSMGGRLALHALLDEPELWDAAVIVSAHPGLADESQKLERMASDAEWAGLALASDWQTFLTKWNAQSVLAGMQLPSRDVLVNRRRAIARSFMEWSLGKQEDLSNRLETLNSPMLWISGEQDQKFTKLASEAAARLPSATLQVFPNCGHRVPWEAGAPFLEQVSSWLSDELRLGQ